MKLQMLSLFSLLLTINVMNGSNVREQYLEYYNKAQEDERTARKAVEEGLKNMAQTEEGRIYIASISAWQECADATESYAIGGKYGHQECESFSETIEEALNDLKKTPEYAEFRLLFKDLAYYRNLEAGLKDIQYLDFTESQQYRWTKEKSRKERFNDAINEAVNSNTLGRLNVASNTNLEWVEVEDLYEGEQRAQDDLRSIVEEVEAGYSKHH